MTFRKCSKCGVFVGPHNTGDIKLNEMGLFFTHWVGDCNGTSFLTFAEVERRANEKANGDPLHALRIEWYQERLKEYHANNK